MHPTALHTPPSRWRRDDLFDALVARILSVCRPQRIVVFGSYARGSEGPDSDVDVLVVDAGVTQRREQGVRIRRALRGLGVPVDVIVATSEDLQRYGEANGLIYGPALREGLVIYEQPTA